MCQKLEGADIIFYGGLELEGRMTDTLVKFTRQGKRPPRSPTASRRTGCASRPSSRASTTRTSGST
jgi:hypothetical protein